MAGVNRPLSRWYGPKHNYVEMISLASSEVPTTHITSTSPPVDVNLWTTAALTLPRMTLASSVNGQPQTAGELALPALILKAATGANAGLALPALTISASVDVRATTRARLSLRALTLTAWATSGGVVSADLTLPGGYGLAAYTGARAALTLPGGYALSASAATGAVSNAELVLPSLTASASITTEATTRATLALPALQMVPTGHAWLTMPALTMHAVVNQVIAVTYEAYAINLTTGVVTHYTNYPFDNILRFGDKFYGVSPTGLFEIGGDLDLTVQIAAHLKTFQTTFGSRNKKRLSAVYNSGRSDGGVIIGVTADEGTTYEYPSDWGGVTGSTNHRTVPGKGIKGVYYSLDVKNVNGGSLQLDTISAEVAHMQRAV